MALTKAERAANAAKSRARGLTNLVTDRDATIRNLRKGVKELKLQKRASRAAHTVSSLLGGATAGAAEGMMGDDTTFELFDVEIPVVGVAAAAARVAVETMDPDSDGASFLAGTADGALAYSVGTMTKTLVSNWTE